MSAVLSRHGADDTAPAPALTARGAAWALAVALGLLVLVNLFIRRYDLEGGRSYGVQGVPPAVAWFLLLVLMLASGALRRLSPRLAFSRPQLLLIFGFLALAIPISSFMGVRSLLPHLSLLPYYAGPENEFARIAAHIPDWLMPKDPRVLIPAYEGSETGAVMWGPWVGPMLLWGGFMLVLGLTTLCVIVLVRHHWNAHEHLSYPLLELPRELVGLRHRSDRTLLADPLMWVGFGTAFLIQTGNIAKYFVPSLPAVPLRTDLAPFLTEEPLRFLLPLRFYIDPVTIGTGYLVPQDLLFSIWSVYLLYKLGGMGAGMLGLRDASFPYYQEQSTGGYLAYGLLLLVAARGQIARLARLAARGQPSREAYPLSPAWAFYGVLAGLGLIVLWCAVNQFALKLAVPYLVILMLYTLVQARLRAETGVPLGWAYPFGTQKTVFDRVLGTRGIMALGGEQGLVMLSFYSWLARYNTLGETATFEADNLTLWESLGLRRRQTNTFLLSALVAGIALGFVIHLSAYYRFGASLLQGGSLYGGANTMVARGEYLGLSAQLVSPAPPDALRLKFMVVGFILTPALALLRRGFLRFPFHPLGFLLATSYGPTPYYWSSMLLAWLAKAAILRIGGARQYWRGLPFFLGLVLGSSMTYDVGWMVVRALLPEGMVTDYV
ncbi:MAG: hypothetical protein KKI08_02485 [Armatimonadetes bacterium]|nr:hypothetical protein [Armatimonadota bacterium]